MAKGISLHIGLNSLNPTFYSGWSGKLNACEADAEDMEALASGQGFNATLLKTKDATRKAVGDALDKAAGELGPEDMLLISYSGHGGQVPDGSGDEVDLQDETWCLFDGQLIDDELRIFYSKFPQGMRILILSDSCHSGTVSRAAIQSSAVMGGFDLENLDIEKKRYRAMPDEAAARTYRTNRKFYDGIQKGLPNPMPNVTASVRLISGCQDNQLSLDGTFNGLFTGQLLRAWSSGNFQGNYSQFHRKIVTSMPATQTPNHFFYGTHDQSYDDQKPFTI